MNYLKKFVFFFLPVCIFFIYAFVWREYDMGRPDTQGYLIVAQDLADGSIDQLNLRTPGYPLLLLLTGSENEPGQYLFYLQLIMYISSIIALGQLLVRLHVPIGMIILFSIIAFLPYNVTTAILAMPEILTIFTLVGGLYFFYLWLDTGKVAYLIAFSLILGIAAITRPTFQLLIFIFLFVLAITFQKLGNYKKKFILASVSLGISTFILIGSLIIINQQKFAFKGLTPLFGFNLSTRTVRVLERLPEEYSGVKKILIYHRNNALLDEGDSHTAEMYIWAAIPDLQKETNLELSKLSDYMKDLNLLLIRQSPSVYMSVVGSAIATYWLPFVEEESYFRSNGLKAIYYFVHFGTIIAFFILLIFSLGLGMVQFFFKRNFAFFQKNDMLTVLIILIPICIIFYSMLISTLFEVGNPRYRVPTDPFILFVVFGLHTFLKNRIVNLLQNDDRIF